MPEHKNGDDVEIGIELPFEKPIARIYRQIAELESQQAGTGRDYSREIRELRAQYISLIRKTYASLSEWETVQVARHPQRPLAQDYIGTMVKNFVELHGDRHFSDDKAIVGGFGQIGMEKVVLISQEKGRGTGEKVFRRFGMSQADGYRKALRLMRLAEKFRLPVVTLIDTAGAYPGIESEERSVAEAIAVNLREMSRLKTPVICIVIGEGGSGGALGIGVGDRIAILQYAYYSVISPEGCASILWRSAEKAAEAAKALKLTAGNLRELGVVDEIIGEPLGGAHRNPAEAIHAVEQYLVRTIRELKRKDIDDLLDERYRAWRARGRVLKGEGRSPYRHLST